MPNFLSRVLPLATIAAGLASTAGAQQVFQATGANAAAIQTTVDNFRNALGALNAPAPVQNTSGRRQINWDAAPDAISAPNAFPGDFFNFGASPRARGAEFTTPGAGFQLSATAASGAGVEFDNIDPSYSGLFTTFSAERLFSPIGSTITDIHFFSPADQTTPALTSGFGAVFTDVDLYGAAFIQAFDAEGGLLQTVIAPEQEGENETLSFAGVAFDSPVIARVRITSGTAPLTPGLTEDLVLTTDLVALDDFIYGEPIPAVPEPAAAALLAICFASLAARRR